MVISLNKCVLYILNLLIDNVKMTEKLFRFFCVDQSLPPENTYVVLILLSESRNCIWNLRNDVKYRKILITPFDLICKFLLRIRSRIYVDYKRMSLMKFEYTWREFCSVSNDVIRYFHILDKQSYSNI